MFRNNAGFPTELVLEIVRFLLSTKECSKVEIVLFLVPALRLSDHAIVVAQVGLQTRRKEMSTQWLSRRNFKRLPKFELLKKLSIFLRVQGTMNYMIFLFLQNVFFFFFFFFFFFLNHSTSDSDSQSLNESGILQKASGKECGRTSHVAVDISFERDCTSQIVHFCWCSVLFVVFDWRP